MIRARQSQAREDESRGLAYEPMMRRIVRRRDEAGTGPADF